MGVVDLFIIFFAIASVVVAVVAEFRRESAENEYKKLRAEIEHSERDEALLEEAKRFTLATVEKSIKLNVQQYECLKEHNLL